MKQPMGKALWSDCETDEERAEFFRSGRDWELGVNDSMAEDIAKAFEDAAKWRARVNDFAVRWNAETHQVSLTAVTGRLVDPGKPQENNLQIKQHIRRSQALDLASGSDISVARIVDAPAKPAPPWGPDAVPLMACEDAEEFSDCKRCFRSTPHVCDYFCKLGSCLACGVNDDACVQVGWRERSKPK